jgi:hypothetical protein
VDEGFAVTTDLSPGFLRFCFCGTDAQKIFRVDYESRADLKIFIVDYASKAGWRNNKKRPDELPGL